MLSKFKASGPARTCFAARRNRGRLSQFTMASTDGFVCCFSREQVLLCTDQQQLYGSVEFPHSCARCHHITEKCQSSKLHLLLNKETNRTEGTWLGHICNWLRTLLLSSVPSPGPSLSDRVKLPWPWTLNSLSNLDKLRTHFLPSVFQLARSAGVHQQTW